MWFGWFMFSGCRNLVRDFRVWFLDESSGVLGVWRSGDVCQEGLRLTGLLF